MHDEHPTLIQEWHGDQMVTEWLYDNETGWSQSLATFDAFEAAQGIAAAIRRSIVTLEGWRKPEA